MGMLVTLYKAEGLFSARVMVVSDSREADGLGEAVVEVNGQAGGGGGHLHTAVMVQCGT